MKGDTIDELCDAVNRLVADVRDDEVPDALAVLEDATRRMQARWNTLPQGAKLTPKGPS